jgi:hypothetical protein
VPSAVVVDKNFLERTSLEAFLRDDARNQVLLHDFSAIESFAGNPMKNLSRTLSIVAKFPAQVLILKNSRTLLALGRIEPQFRFDMVDWRQTRSFGAYCQDVRKAESGDAERLARVMAQAQAANQHLATMLTIVPLMIELITRLAAETSQELLESRRRDDMPMPREGGTKLLHEIFHIAAAMAHRGNAPGIPAKLAEAAQHYVFRFATALRLFALRWAENGSDVREVKPERLRNDLVDLMYVTCATYWDGFLTRESRMEDLYAEVSFLVNDFFPRSPG